MLFAKIDLRQPFRQLLRDGFSGVQVHNNGILHLPDTDATVLVRSFDLGEAP